MDTRITNIVVTAKLSGTLNLKDVTTKLVGSVYDPEHFPAVRYKPDRKMPVSYLLYSTGSVVIAGCTSVDSAKERGDEIAKMLGLSIKDLTVRNVVGLARLNRELLLENVAKIEEDVDYAPDIFPGARLRIAGVVPTFLVFKSGSIVVAGSRSSQEFGESVTRLVKLFDDNKAVYKSV